MKLTQNKKLKPGMTLIELTVVIIVLLTLISVLFFAGTAYIKASNRTACLTNQATIQKAMRGYATLNQLATASDAIAADATASPPVAAVDAVTGATIDWATIAAAGFIGSNPTAMSCPTNDKAYDPLTVVVKQGALVSPCPDISTLTDHVANDISNY